jgi:hypothetical protein
MLFVASGGASHGNHVRRGTLFHHVQSQEKALRQPKTAGIRKRGLGSWRVALVASLALCFVLGAIFVLHRSAALISRPFQARDSKAPRDSAEQKLSVRSPSGENNSLTAELKAAEQRETALIHKLQESNDALAAGRAREAQLASKIDELTKARLESAEKESATTSVLAQLKLDLQASRSENEANRKAVGEAQADLLGQSAEIGRVTAQLEDERKLNATLTEAQDLLVNPDVQVLPVFDHDNNGRVLFGRILYTQGKKLIFYAYNLPNGRGSEMAFYVWGEKPGTHQPLRNLGILRADNTKASRWKLTFDDPNVLAKINSIFVTAESGKTASEPRGKRMLSASLDPNVSHP